MKNDIRELKYAAVVLTASICFTLFTEVHGQVCCENFLNHECMTEVEYFDILDIMIRGQYF